MVRTTGCAARGGALVFPLLCVVAAASCSRTRTPPQPQAEFLLEVTHAPLGVLGSSSMGRWLELRLAAPEDRLPGRVWRRTGVFGVLLLLYRES